MSKLKKTDLIAGGAAALAAGAAAVTAGAVLIAKTAIEREPPKVLKAVRHVVSGGAIAEPELEQIRAASERLSHEPIETVHITSRDGLSLTGHWYPAEGARRIIIAMHGWRSSWDRDFGVPTAFFHDTCKSSVLYPDQRGQDGSDGDYIGFGVLERYDCLDWLDYVLQRFGDTLPIYLCGISMGASTVLMADGLGLPSQVHGIIADCGFTSPHAVWSHIFQNNLHVSDRLAYPICNLICNRKANYDGDEVSTVDAMRQSGVPVLLIHGEEDRFVPVEMSYENYAACIAPKKLLIVPGATHGMSYFVNREAYQRMATEFFADFDAVPSPGGLLCEV